MITLVEGEARREVVRIHQALADGARVAQDEAGGLPFLIPASELKRLSDAMKDSSAKAPAMPQGLEGLEGLEGLGLPEGMSPPASR